LFELPYSVALGLKLSCSYTVYYCVYWM